MFPQRSRSWHSPSRYSRWGDSRSRDWRSWQRKGGRVGPWVLSGALGGAVVAGPVALTEPAVAAGDRPGGPARPTGRVVAKEGLVVRTGPSNRYRAVGAKR